MLNTIKPALKKIIGYSGYEFKRVNTQTRFLPYVKEIELVGLNLKFWISSEGAQYWYSDENFMLEAQHLKNLIEPGDNILDVGCNIGVLTTIMATLTGSNGSVTAIDILPDNCMITCAQLGLNSLTNVEVLNIGADEKSGTVTIADNSNSGIIIDKNTERKTLNVKTIPLDNLLDKSRPFNLIKMDVEGFEVSALKGAQEILKTKPKIALEIHGPHLLSYNTNMEALFKTIGIENYEGVFIHKYSNKIEPFNAAEAVKNPPLGNAFLKPKK